MLSTKSVAWSGLARTTLKRLALGLLGPYELQRIYSIELTSGPRTAPAGFDVRPILASAEATGSPDPLIRDHAWFIGENSHAFGLWDGGALVCMAVFWNARRFNDPVLIPLTENDAVMVDIVTAADRRGRGYAAAVMRYAESALQQAGFRRLHAYVWFSHESSKRAFDKAGWSYTAFVVRLKPIGFRRPISFRRSIR